MKIERMKVKKLVEEAKEREKQEEEYMFKFRATPRNMKIKKIKKR